MVVGAGLNVVVDAGLNFSSWHVALGAGLNVSPSEALLVTRKSFPWMCPTGVDIAPLCQNYLRLSDKRSRGCPRMGWLNP